uniref:Uncharacterized protein n=1 Tax=viral metagenome TaxID=1070528 RepID=A0A6C0L0Q1_9ZZZZ|tara:strand:- start:22052 stop:22288 length:237 start_codon:yes stop_codon:yes gene_type:complete
MNDLMKETLAKNFDLYVQLLDNNDFKKHLIRELNEDVDIPIINEKTEKKLLNALYKVILSSLKKVDVVKLLEYIEDKK